MKEREKEEKREREREGEKKALSDETITLWIIKRFHSVMLSSGPPSD